MSQPFQRDLGYTYAAVTEGAWDRKMRQEAADELRHEEANPNVYKPEDGHAYVNVWDRGDGRCDKCGHIIEWHINKGSTA